MRSSPPPTHTYTVLPPPSLPPPTHCSPSSLTPPSLSPPPPPHTHCPPLLPPSSLPPTHMCTLFSPPPSLPPSPLQAVVTRVMEVQQLSADTGGGSTLVDCGPAGQLRLERHLSLAGEFMAGFVVFPCIHGRVCAVHQHAWQGCVPSPGIHASVLCRPPAFMAGTAVRQHSWPGFAAAGSPAGRTRGASVLVQKSASFAA